MIELDKILDLLIWICNAMVGNGDCLTSHILEILCCLLLSKVVGFIFLYFCFCGMTGPDTTSRLCDCSIIETVDDLGLMCLLLKEVISFL